MATKKAATQARRPAAAEVAVNRIKDVAVRTTDVNHVDVNLISIHKDLNPRDYRLPENRAHLDELMRSIQENGVKVPVLVRMDPNTKEIILLDGECRVRSCLELIKLNKPKKGKDGTWTDKTGEEVKYLTVPTTQLSDREYPKDEDKLLQALLANQGKPLSQWEHGNAFRKFLKAGWTLEQVVKRSGYNHKYVADAIALDKAPEELKQALTEQAITPSLASATLKQFAKGDKKAIAKTIQKAAAAKAAGRKTPLGVRAAAAKPTAAQQRTAAAARAEKEAKAATNGNVGPVAAQLLVSARKDIKESVQEGYPYVSVKMKLIEALTNALGGQKKVFGETVFPEA